MTAPVPEIMDTISYIVKQEDVSENIGVWIGRGVSQALLF
jgi:hypothetical protein